MLHVLDNIGNNANDNSYIISELYDMSFMFAI